MKGKIDTLSIISTKLTYYKISLNMLDILKLKITTKHFS